MMAKSNGEINPPGGGAGGNIKLIEGSARPAFICPWAWGLKEKMELYKKESSSVLDSFLLLVDPGGGPATVWCRSNSSGYGVERTGRNGGWWAPGSISIDRSMSSLTL